MGAFSDTVHTIGVRLSGLSGDELARAFNESLASLLPGFFVEGGTTYDIPGARAEAESIIATAAGDRGGFPADAAAVAPVIQPKLDAGSLREGYKRIGAIKALIKSKPETDRQTATLGLIVASSSQLSMGAIGLSGRPERCLKAKIATISLGLGQASRLLAVHCSRRARHS